MPKVPGSTNTTFLELHLPIPEAIYLGFSHDHKKVLNINDNLKDKIKGLK
jgi:hypothetical protein